VEVETVNNLPVVFPIYYPFLNLDNEIQASVIFYDL